MEKRWKILPADEPVIDLLQASLGISRVICTMLVQRHISSFDEAKKYFRPSLQQLHSPWLMKDMDKAVNRLLKAFELKEKILVFGDYDVDGTTAVSGMYHFLGQAYTPTQLDFYIPHRYREGYGVSKAGIDFAYTNGFSLVISLDCGIKSIELVRYAKELGIDFIICDHHLPDELLPPAIAILNPKQKDCLYPYKELCGCGVGYKLICALAEKLQLDPLIPTQYLDLVATAIAADIVPITGENRVLAYLGLQKINTDPRPGIKALISLGAIKKALTISTVVFVIAPRVNAAGRMDDARKAVQLFIEPDYNRAYEYAEMLHHDNADRKEADTSITEQALEMLNSQEDILLLKSSVLFREDWHKGVVGIVASRLMEHYYRPTVVLTKSGDLATGSARSVAGFNLYDAIYACREYLTAYGGHFAAAGLSMPTQNIEPFKKKFEEVVSETIEEHMLVPEIIIDAEIEFTDIKQNLYKIIQQMEPFGPGNMRPTFIARRVKDTGYSKILKEQHLRLIITQNNLVMNGIGFNLAPKAPLLNNEMDIVFTLDENEWNGNTTLQLKVIDIRASA